LVSLVSLESFFMKLAIAADWLTTPGGAEQVIHEFTLLYPDAPLLTTVARDDFFPKERRKTVRRSWLQALYAIVPKHQALLPWLPRAMEDLDTRGFDVVLSSSHAVGKGVIPSPSTLHVCYCHTPMRYAWEMEDEYLRDFGVPQFLRTYAKRTLRDLRRWDLTTAKRTDVFFANSTTTQERIARTYRRESIVIPPPVGDRFFEVPLTRPSGTLSRRDGRGTASGASQGEGYFLAVGRFVPYKRFDLVIALANKLGLPLKIAGRGQEEASLKAMAGSTVEFLGFVPDSELPGLFAHAEAVFFPQFEDAGLVLLEGLACGTPAIAYNAGGARDAVKPGETGVFFDTQTVESMEAAMEAFKKVSWDRAKIRELTRPFSRAAFRERIQAEIKNAFASFEESRRAP
jgi:glycosyltransferase involved in cell wall biosynthesis